MLHHLFTSVNLKSELTPRKTYAALLTDIAREASDAKAALSLFDDLVTSNDHASSTGSFLSFDAHGGDTGCHLRAGMIEDLFRYKQSLFQSSKSTSAMTHVSTGAVQHRLEHVIQRSQHICHQLTQERVPPKTFGLGTKKDVPASFLDACEWSEDFWGDRHDDLTETEQLSCPTNKLASAPTRHRTPSEDAGSSSDSAYSGNASSIISRNTSTQASSKSGRSSLSDDGSRWPLSTVWDMSNLATMVRFLVYAYVLTKYKAFSRSSDGPVCRLDQEKAFKYGNELMRPYWNTANVDYQVGLNRRIGFQLRAMQKWITDLSCAWLESLADRNCQNPRLGRLVLNTLQTSPTGLAVCACYPAYLLQRHHWATQAIPIIFVDQHFCSEGYHWNVFKAQSIQLKESPTGSANPDTNVGSTVEQVNVEEMLVSKSEDTPHMVILGNSIEGPYSAYLDRVSQGTQEVYHHRSPQHEEEECIENSTHINAFLATDLDKVMLSTFAAHQQYPWCPLSSGEQGNQFTLDCMDKIRDQSQPDVERDNFSDGNDNYNDIDNCSKDDIKTNFLADTQAAPTLGAGKSNISTFDTQHIFLETKARAAAILKYRIEHSDQETFLPFYIDDEIADSRPVEV